MTMEVGKAVWQLLRARPYLAAAVAIVLALGGGYGIARIARADRTRLKDNVAEALEVIGNVMQEYRARLGAAAQLLDEGTVVEAVQRTPLQRVAHLLAVSPRPLLMREIVEALSASEPASELRTPEVSEILRGHRAFLRDSTGRWIVGGYIRPRRAPALKAAD